MSKDKGTNSDNTDRRIDDLDIKILRALLKNSRKPFSEIAKDCNVSTVTINKRFNELTKAGIITGSSVIVDLAAFGVQCDSNLDIVVNPSQLDEFMKEAKVMLGEFSVWRHELAESNVGAWAPIKDIRVLEKLRKSLKQHSAVIEVKSNVWTYMLVIPENLSLETCP